MPVGMTPESHFRALMNHRLQSVVWGLSGSAALLVSTLYPWSFLDMHGDGPDRMYTMEDAGMGSLAIPVLVMSVLAASRPGPLIAPGAALCATGLLALEVDLWTSYGDGNDLQPTSTFYLALVSTLVLAMAWSVLGYRARYVLDLEDEQPRRRCRLAWRIGQLP